MVDRDESKKHLSGPSSPDDVSEVELARFVRLLDLEMQAVGHDTVKGLRRLCDSTNLASFNNCLPLVRAVYSTAVAFRFSIHPDAFRSARKRVARAERGMPWTHQLILDSLNLRSLTDTHRMFCLFERRFDVPSFARHYVRLLVSDYVQQTAPDFIADAAIWEAVYLRILTIILAAMEWKNDHKR